MKHFTNKSALLEAIAALTALGKNCSWRPCNKLDGVAGWLLFF